MAKTNLITGLDVGSGKLTCIAAAHDFETNTLKVLAGRSVPCRGIKGGWCRISAKLPPPLPIF